jgi:hypothetical protein
MQKPKSNRSLRLTLLSLLALLVSIVQPAFLGTARAGTLTNTYVRETRMQASTASALRVVFSTVNTVSTGGKLVLTFSSGSDTNDTGNGYTINTSQTTSVSTCPTESGATALPGTLSATGSNTSGSKSITITGLTALAATTAYCVDLTGSAITNPASTGNATINVADQTSGSAVVDSTYVGLDALSSDQITVSAMVPPSFTLALSGTTDSLGTVTTGTVAVSSGRTATMTTNAVHGWIAWVEDLNAGLTSATASYTINTNGPGVGSAAATIANNSDNYVLDAQLTTNASGSAAIAAPYNGGATSLHKGGSFSSTVYQKVGSATGTTSGDVLTLNELAAVGPQTPAANDYTDTITYIAAGNF